jgi:hypothetical protein
MSRNERLTLTSFGSFLPSPAAILCHRQSVGIDISGWLGNSGGVKAVMRDTPELFVTRKLLMQRDIQLRTGMVGENRLLEIAHNCGFITICLTDSGADSGAPGGAELAQDNVHSAL